MTIHLTDHAIEALRTRLACNPGKYLKIATKAWNSTEAVSDGEIANRRHYEKEVFPHKNTQYRKLMGRIFIFDTTQPKTAVLVTMYPSCWTIAKVAPAPRFQRPISAIRPKKPYDER